MFKFRTLFFNYIEIILTLLGLVVIFVAPFIFSRQSPWPVIALTATGVGVIHGLVFFIVRAQQRKARQIAVSQLKESLDDLVRNKLQIIQLTTGLVEEYIGNIIDDAVSDMRISLGTIEFEKLMSTRRPKDL